MADNPSPETQTRSDAQQDVFDHHSALADSRIQSQQMDDITQHLIHGVDGVTRRPTLGWFRTRQEARQSSESHEEVVGSQVEGGETRQSSENYAETAVNSQAEGGEARSLELEDQPNPSPSIFEDDTMVKLNCYEDYRLEIIEDRLLPVSDCESDHCPICREKYNTKLDAPIVVKDKRYCTDCQRSFNMKPDTINSHKACAMRNCSHVFGRYCIIQWLKSNSTCPLYRNAGDL
ncbi:uncharacterized protein EAF01_011257 [Botrytis porri]|nr:uncharacterized protein EAF01_011257 [Botrytis porri]KAF7886579.1 hypothetical protein EAF01_011257 [Botrytis porri]